MGFFNFLYKLSNIFTNKKRLKFFIVVGIILLIFFGCSRGVFASSGNSQDEETIMLIQLNLQENLVQTLINMKDNPSPGFDLIAYNQIVYALANFQVYVAIPTGDPDTNFWVYFYNPVSNGNNPNMFTVEGTFSTGLNSGIQIDCMLGNITAARFARVRPQYQNRQTPIFSSDLSSVYMPSSCYYVRSTYINDFVMSEGYNSSFSPTFSTSDQELQSITRSGFSSVNSTIQNQTNTMTNSINSASASITNSIDSVENTLTDTTTDDSQVEFVSENNQDITSGFFTSIFTNLQNRFTTGQFSTVVFNVPFTGKRFVVTNRYIIENVVNNEKFSVLVTIAQNFWWFALGYYVILDIYKKINKLKSGDLTNIENENITTDLL